MLTKTRHLSPVCIRERAHREVDGLPAKCTNGLVYSSIHKAHNVTTQRKDAALFTSLVAEPTHLELDESFSAKHCLLVFHRFIGINPKSSKVFSKNIMNFIEAEREFNAMPQKLKERDKFNGLDKEKGITLQNQINIPELPTLKEDVDAWCDRQIKPCIVLFI